MFLDLSSAYCNGLTELMNTVLCPPENLLDCSSDISRIYIYATIGQSHCHADKYVLAICVSN